MSDSLKKLDDENVEDVAGGYIFDARDYNIVRIKHWEVIDENGDVVSRHESIWDAQRAAEDLGLSTEQLTVRGLEQLRKNASQ